MEESMKGENKGSSRFATIPEIHSHSSRSFAGVDSVLKENITSHMKPHKLSGPASAFGDSIFVSPTPRKKSPLPGTANSKTKQKRTSEASSPIVSSAETRQPTKRPELKVHDNPVNEAAPPPTMSENRKQPLSIRERERIYDVNLVTKDMPLYEPLLDEGLQDFFSSPVIRKHLMKVGLITEDGKVIPKKQFKRNQVDLDHVDKDTRNCKTEEERKLDREIERAIWNHLKLSNERVSNEFNPLPTNLKTEKYPEYLSAYPVTMWKAAMLYGEKPPSMDVTEKQLLSQLQCMSPKKIREYGLDPEKIIPQLNHIKAKAKLKKISPKTIAARKAEVHDDISELEEEVASSCSPVAKLFDMARKNYENNDMNATKLILQELVKIVGGPPAPTSPMNSTEALDVIDEVSRKAKNSLENAEILLIGYIKKLGGDIEKVIQHIDIKKEASKEKQRSSFLDEAKVSPDAPRLSQRLRPTSARPTRESDYPVGSEFSDFGSDCGHEVTSQIMAANKDLISATTPVIDELEENPITDFDYASNTIDATVEEVDLHQLTKFSRASLASEVDEEYLQTSNESIPSRCDIESSGEVFGVDAAFPEEEILLGYEVPNESAIQLYESQSTVSKMEFLSDHVQVEGFASSQSITEDIATDAPEDSNFVQHTALELVNTVNIQDEASNKNSEMQESVHMPEDPIDYAGLHAALEDYLEDSMPPNEQHDVGDKIFNDDAEGEYETHLVANSAISDQFYKDPPLTDLILGDDEIRVFDSPMSLSNDAIETHFEDGCGVSVENDPSVMDAKVIDWESDFEVSVTPQPIPLKEVDSRVSFDEAYAEDSEAFESTGTLRPMEDSELDSNNPENDHNLVETGSYLSLPDENLETITENETLNGKAVATRIVKLAADYEKKEVIEGIQAQSESEIMNRPDDNKEQRKMIISTSPETSSIALTSQDIISVESHEFETVPEQVLGDSYTSVDSETSSRHSLVHNMTGGSQVENEPKQTPHSSYSRDQISPRRSSVKSSTNDLLLKKSVTFSDKNLDRPSEVRPVILKNEVPAEEILQTKETVMEADHNSGLDESVINVLPQSMLDVEFSKVDVNVKTTSDLKADLESEMVKLKTAKSTDAHIYVGDAKQVPSDFVTELSQEQNKNNFTNFVIDGKNTFEHTHRIRGGTATIENEMAIEKKDHSQASNFEDQIAPATIPESFPSNLSLVCYEDDFDLAAYISDEGHSNQQHNSGDHGDDFEYTHNGSTRNDDVHVEVGVIKTNIFYSERSLNDLNGSSNFESDRTSSQEAFGTGENDHSRDDGIILEAVNDEFKLLNDQQALDQPISSDKSNGDAFVEASPDIPSNTKHNEAGTTEVTDNDDRYGQFRPMQPSDIDSMKNEGTENTQSVCQNKKPPANLENIKVKQKCEETKRDLDVMDKMAHPKEGDNVENMQPISTQIYHEQFNLHEKGTPMEECSVLPALESSDDALNLESNSEDGFQLSQTYGSDFDIDLVDIPAKVPHPEEDDNATSYELLYESQSTLAGSNPNLGSKGAYDTDSGLVPDPYSETSVDHQKAEDVTLVHDSMQIPSQFTLDASVLESRIRLPESAIESSSAVSAHNPDMNETKMHISDSNTKETAEVPLAVVADGSPPDPSSCSPNADKSWTQENLVQIASKILLPESIGGSSSSLSISESIEESVAGELKSTASQDNPLYISSRTTLPDGDSVLIGNIKHSSTEAQQLTDYVESTGIMSGIEIQSYTGDSTPLPNIGNFIKNIDGTNMADVSIPVDSVVTISESVPFENRIANNGQFSRSQPLSNSINDRQTTTSMIGTEKIKGEPACEVKSTTELVKSQAKLSVSINSTPAGSSADFATASKQNQLVSSTPTHHKTSRLQDLTATSNPSISLNGSNTSLSSSESDSDYEAPFNVNAKGSSTYAERKPSLLVTSLVRRASNLSPSATTPQKRASISSNEAEDDLGDSLSRKTVRVSAIERRPSKSPLALGFPAAESDSGSETSLMADGSGESDRDQPDVASTDALAELLEKTSSTIDDADQVGSSPEQRKSPGDSSVNQKEDADTSSLHLTSLFKSMESVGKTRNGMETEMEGELNTVSMDAQDPSSETKHIMLTETQQNRKDSLCHSQPEISLASDSKPNLTGAFAIQDISLSENFERKAGEADSSTSGEDVQMTTLFKSLLDMTSDSSMRPSESAENQQMDVENFESATNPLDTPQSDNSDPLLYSNVISAPTKSSPEISSLRKNTVTTAPTALTRTESVSTSEAITTAANQEPIFDVPILEQVIQGLNRNNRQTVESSIDSLHLANLFHSVLSVDQTQFSSQDAYIDQTPTKVVVAEGAAQQSDSRRQSTTDNHQAQQSANSLRASSANLSQSFQQANESNNRRIPTAPPTPPPRHSSTPVRHFSATTYKMNPRASSVRSLMQEKKPGLATSQFDSSSNQSQTSSRSSSTASTIKASKYKSVPSLASTQVNSRRQSYEKVPHGNISQQASAKVNEKPRSRDSTSKSLTSSPMVSIKSSQASIQQSRQVSRHQSKESLLHQALATAAILTQESKLAKPTSAAGALGDFADVSNLPAQRASSQVAASKVSDNPMNASRVQASRAASLKGSIYSLNEVKNDGGSSTRPAAQAPPRISTGSESQDAPGRKSVWDDILSYATST